MKTKLSFFLFMFFTQLAVGNNIDSLKIVSQTSINPRESVKADIALSNYYFYSMPDSSLYYIQKGILVAKKNKLIKEHLYLLTSLGIHYNESGELQLAEKTFQHTLRLARATQDTMQVISVLGNLGNNHMMRGNFDDALGYYTETVDMYQKLGNKKGMAYSYGAIGNMYNKKRTYKKNIQKGY